MYSDRKLFMVVGIPGSGKSTLVNKLALMDKGSLGVSCSALLKDILVNNQCDSWSQFDELCELERKSFIRKVTERLQHLKGRYKSIYADAHMLVWNRVTHVFEVALNDDDAALMDGLIFLDTSPKTVAQNITLDNRDGTRERPEKSLSSLRDHRKQELDAAQEFCERHDLPLIIVSNEDNQYSIQDVLNQLSRKAKLEPASIESLSTQINSHLGEINAQPGPALVLDGDRTLSESDAFRMLDTALGLRELNRQSFESFGYSLQSFQAVSENWKLVSIDNYQTAIATVADEIRLRKEWVDTLSNLPKETPVFLVTAGIPQLWEHILRNHELYNIRVIGGTHPYFDKELITPVCKSKIVKLLRELDYWIIASGDSPIDAEMLNASDLAIVTPDSKGSTPLIKEIKKPNDWFYLSVEGYKDQSNAMTHEAITSLILGMQNIRKHSFLTTVSKPSIVSSYLKSRTHNANREDLISAHKQIGKLFMQHMLETDSDFTLSKTVAIGVERSGRYLAEGAISADNIPLLSAYPVPPSINRETEMVKPASSHEFVIPHLPHDLNTIVIFDSVIHSGDTIQKVIDALPSHKDRKVHVFCTEINEAAVSKIESLREKASFHCIRMSSRQFRPLPNKDMGARLFGTAS